MPEKTRQLWVIVGLSYFEGNACYSSAARSIIKCFFPQARKGAKLKSFSFRLGFGCVAAAFAEETQELSSDNS